jgi:hypothetical protein
MCSQVKVVTRVESEEEMFYLQVLLHYRVLWRQFCILDKLYILL